VVGAVGEVGIAGDGAGVVDGSVVTGSAVGTAKGAEVDHLRAVPQEGMIPPVSGQVAGPGHVAGVV